MIARTNENNTDPSDASALLGYKFTPAELKAIEECNHESFVQRSLPLGALCAGAAWYAVKTGYLQPSKRFGPTPKALIGGILGYVIGKFSYQSKCEEKFMQIPDSKIGQILRERKQKSGTYYGGEFDPGLGGGFGTQPSLPYSSGSSQQSSDGFSDIAPRTYADLDTDRPLTNLDDSFPMNGFSHIPSSNDNLSSAAPPPTYTYEELRRKNREEYEQSKVKQYSRPQKPTPPPSSSNNLDELGIASPEPPSPSQPPTTGSWSKQRNIYGDVWEK